VPSHQVNKLNDGNYNIFIKKKDFFYFTNSDDATKNKFMTGNIVAKQLSHDKEKELSVLDEKISRLNKIISAIDGLSSDDLRKVETSEAILSDLKIDKSTKRGDLNKTIEEVKFERQVLNEQFHDIVEKYKTYQGVKENDTIKNKEVKR